MGWVEIRHPDGSREIMGDPPAWLTKDDDYVCPMTGEAYNHPRPAPRQEKTLKRIFWFRVQFYDQHSPWRGCGIEKIKTDFNPLQQGV